jgi:uncharacterized protein (TIGR03545 family)
MTDNATAQTPPPAKKKKPKGMFRTGAVVPCLIIIALIWAYFFFFFDTHLRHGLEYAGTHGNGAEVDIASVRTSFWNASLEIRGIQVTDGTTPKKNKIQIGEMRWAMLWDALLRGKIAIEDASILDIAVGVTRAKPGYVLPPDPPSSESAFGKMRKEALANAQQQFSQNVLGDAAGILGGVNPKDQLKNIEGNLKSAAKVKELQAELTKKQTEWKDRLAKLPQKQDLDDLQKRIKAVKLDHFDNPMQVQASLQQINTIYNETQAKIKSVQETANSLNGDVNTYKNTLTDLDKMVKDDVKDLEGRLKLPSLDVKTLSRQVFGPLFLGKVKQAEFYYSKAREYMPPKKTMDQKKAAAALTTHEREKGRNYAFGKPRAYPLFWLKHAALSSKATAGADYSGDLVGTIRNATNDQPMLGLPLTAEFKGDFPKQELHGVDGKITIDHTKEDSDDKVEINVASFPVIGQKLVDTPDVQLGFDKATSNAAFVAELRDAEIKIAVNSLFQRAKAGEIPQDPNAQPEPQPVSANPTAITDIKSASDLLGDTTKMAARKSTGFLQAQAKSPALNDILNGALSDIPKVTLNASVHGPWSALDFDINSSLGQDLANAFDKQIKAKVDEAKARVQALVNAQISEQKAKLEAEFNKQKAQIDGILKDKQAELDKYKGQLDQEKNAAVNGQKSKVEDAAKKGLDDLRNKFHF